MAASLVLHKQIIALRPQLLRFAKQRVKNEAIAEDVVQESLLALLETPQRYAGKSSLATYVTGILKFKIIDSYRYAQQMNLNRDQDFFDEAWNNCEAQNAANERYGISQSSLCAAVNPLAALEQKNFFASLEHALNQLPLKPARAFRLAACLELDSADICRELDITKNNLTVAVHRARHALRDSPALRGFAPGMMAHPS